MMTHVETEALNAQIYNESSFLDNIRRETSKVIVGQHDMVQKLLLAVLCGGNVLLEGLPGLAKTLAIKTLAQAVDGEFSRIQFTPDLLPADITGTMIYNPGKNEFTPRMGPVFANFILADEINRAPAKVQSALLEAMQEKQVTIGSESYDLPKLFMVLATQNPIEQEGTYLLPEAQTDRFLFKLKIQYPSKVEEQEIIRRNMQGIEDIVVKPVSNQAQILQARKTIRSIYMDEKIERYIVDIVNASRFPAAVGLPHLNTLIQYGASPRASISLALTSKAMAYMHQRAYVVPEDVHAVCFDVLRHRIGLTYEAEAENIGPEDIIQQILNTVQIP
ncbi:MAG: AAA family ATPase [Saprospiraceae bacterium]